MLHVKDESHQHVHGNISEELEGGVAWKSKIKTIKIHNKEKELMDKRKKKINVFKITFVVTK